MHNIDKQSLKLSKLLLPLYHILSLCEVFLTGLFPLVFGTSIHNSMVTNGVESLSLDDFQSTAYVLYGMLLF